MARHIQATQVQPSVVFMLFAEGEALACHLTQKPTRLLPQKQKKTTFTTKEARKQSIPCLCLGVVNGSLGDLT
jgi:hypothetical protein